MRKYISLLALTVLLSCSKSEFEDQQHVDKSAAHICKFQYCPYKGYTLNQYERGIEDEDNDETASPGSDAYYIDYTHFLFPDWDYDQCEEYTFKIVKP